MGGVMTIYALLKQIPGFYLIVLIPISCVSVGIILIWIQKLYYYFYYPLEITYNNGRYNERKDIITNNREIYKNAVIYRVGVYNTSKKTIESVSVIVQGEIEIVKNPQKAYWAKTKQYKCDINPGEMEFANLFASNDGLKKQITITVTGKDIPKVVKEIVL